MKEISTEQSLFSKFVIQLAHLESERIPYSQVKQSLKEVILMLVARTDPDLGLLKMALHNLAAVNYIEILEFTESNEDLIEAHGQLRKIDLKKKEEKEKNDRLQAELEMQEREKKHQERLKTVRKQARQQLADYSIRSVGDKSSKLYSPRLKAAKMLSKQASRISRAQLMRNPYFRNLDKIMNATDPETVRKRSSLKAPNLIVDLMQGSLIDTPVVDIVGFEQPGLDWRTRTGGQRLPHKSVSSFYEQLVFRRLGTVQPLLSELPR